MAQDGASVVPSDGGPSFATFLAPGATTAAFTRHPAILDLPNEVLDSIFHHLPIENHIRTTSRPDVKSTRLSCRRFRNLSSRHLISHITVNVTRASLSRLEGVSLHPLISRGISSVSLNLALFDLKLAEHFELYRKYQAVQLREAIRKAEGCIEQATNFVLFRDYQLNHISTDTPEARNLICASIDKEILESAESLISGDFLGKALTLVTQAEDWERPAPSVLLEGFEDYRNYSNSQEELLEQGLFCRNVASALAAMPLAKKLTIHDDDEVSPSEFSMRVPLADIRMMSSDEYLRQKLARPLVSLKVARRHTTTALIPSILAGLGEAGVLLSSLEIYLSDGWSTLLLMGVKYAPSSSQLPPRFHLNHLTWPTDWKLLKASTKHLRHLTYKHDHHMKDGNPFTGSVTIQQNFLSALMDTDTLETIKIDTGCEWFREHFQNFTPERSRAGGPIRSLDTRSWPNLQHISLAGMLLSCEDLASLTSHHNQAMRVVSLVNVCLRDGSWAGILDGLRHANLSSSLLVCPEGAECRPEILSDVNYTDIFELSLIGRLSEESKADLYIQGRLKHNPLREALRGGS